MTDRQLLEMAAKSYWADTEVSWKYSEEDDGIAYLDAANQDHNGQDVWLIWNPRDDDGDALRLAVKLRISIDWLEHGVDAYRDDMPPLDIEPLGSEHYKACRRAIVRAAAAIGENMK